MKYLADRGTRELNYHVFATGTPLQRQIQMAGNVSERLKIENAVKDMPKPNVRTLHDDYNSLATKLTRYAENPNTAGLGAWNKLNKEVLDYFDSNLPVYADPESPLTEKGFTLKTRPERELYYFDGEKNRLICEFSNAKDWVAIQNMFPSLFNPSIAVGMGFLSNYTTLQPEKYIQLIYLARRLNPEAEFDKYVETNFIPLFANLSQHAAFRALLAKHTDPRTQEQIVEDLVKEMLTTISSAVVNGEGKPEVLEVIQNIAEYLNSGDFSKLADSVQKYDEAWVTRATTWYYSSEVDKTLNMIKELRQSNFLDTALKMMLDRQYGANRNAIYLEEWQQKILGRAHETGSEEEEIQDKVSHYYGEGATLEKVIQSKAERLRINDIRNLDEMSLKKELAEYGIDNLEKIMLTKLITDSVPKESRDGLLTRLNVPNLPDKIFHQIKEAALELIEFPIVRQGRGKVATNEALWQDIRQEILEEVQKNRTSAVSILNQIANEISGAPVDLGKKETQNDEPEEGYESHIEDFGNFEDKVSAMWQQHRVTKAAIQESLTAMLEKLTALQEDNQEVDLPKIPLPHDLILEEVGPENKIIIEHIRDCITRLQDKAENDQSKKTMYQTDCAWLQNSINKILNFQYAGGEEDDEGFFMMTEEQRAVYNEVGVALTDILNKTQKQPLKEKEVIRTVEPVVAELHRLINFHNKIREKLTRFQAKLKALDQGTYFNEIRAYTKKDGPLDQKQKELESLLDSLVNLPQTEKFNVLSPENEWQRTVNEVVDKLNEPGSTAIVERLQDVLLYQPGKEKTVMVNGTEQTVPVEREYKSVIPKSERLKAPKAAQEKDQLKITEFRELMEGYGGIKAFAETLIPNETSKLKNFFEETEGEEENLSEGSLHSPDKLGVFGGSLSRTGSGSFDNEEDLEGDFFKRKNSKW